MSSRRATLQDGGCFWSISKISIYKLASLRVSGSAGSKDIGGKGRRGMGPESLVVHNRIMSELTGRSNDGAEHKELHSQTTGAAFWRTLKNQVCEM